MNLSEYRIRKFWEKEPRRKDFVHESMFCHIYRDSVGVLHGIIALKDEYYPEGVSWIEMSNITQTIPVRDYKISLPDIPKEFKDPDRWIGVCGSASGRFIPAFWDQRKLSLDQAEQSYFNIEMMEEELRTVVDRIIIDRAEVWDRHRAWEASR